MSTTMLFLASDSPKILPPQIRERLIKSYGLVQDDANEKWNVDEKKLKEILRPAVEQSADDCEELPPLRKLVKRMRKLLTVGGEDSTEEAPDDNPASDAKTAPTSHNFYVIDQSDRNNILLAEMIRGKLVLKQAAKVNTVKLYVGWISDEIGARIDALAESGGNDELIQSLKKAKKDMQLYLNTIKKTSRAAKNILRVMVSA